jgi:hypothetical protein
MEGLEIEGTPFSVLMQQAVKLKTHVHKIDRVKFDKWPKFYQNSVYVKDAQKAERTLAFAERLKVAKDYKTAGDAWLKGGVRPCPQTPCPPVLKTRRRRSTRCKRA